MPIETTVIGSFPKSNSSFENALREIVDLQLSCGIDLITDGELRSNMIQYFEQIPGLERLGDGLRIVGKIEPMERDRVDEFYKINDYRRVRSILKNSRKKECKSQNNNYGSSDIRYYLCFSGHRKYIGAL